MEKYIKKIIEIIKWLIIIGLLIALIFMPEQKVVNSGYQTCSSTFHTNCEGICKHGYNYVLHYGYHNGKCKFESFNEIQKDKMYEEFCKII